MLTSLTIGGATYDAVHLLSLLQQAWPSMEAPTGSGEAATGYRTPWKPQTAKQWYWCAKRVAQFTRTSKFAIPQDTEDTKGTQFWFDIGGQLISIQAGTLYARYHGAVPTPPPKGAPKKLPADISYSGIYMKLLEDNSDHIVDTAVAAECRAILTGQTACAKSQSLSLLASVMFISEVARNHTAFHTGLMLLDLIEKGITVDTSQFQYTLRNSLCNPSTVDALIRRRQEPTHQIPKMQGEADDKPKSGGEAAIIGLGMGLAPMSHALSESGGALDLDAMGSFVPARTQPTDPLSQTRRKEATLLIRWLFEALTRKGGIEVSAGDSEFQYGKPYNFGVEYFTSDSARMMDRVHILPLLVERVSKLDCML